MAITGAIASKCRNAGQSLCVRQAYYGAGRRLRRLDHPARRDGRCGRSPAISSRGASAWAASAVDLTVKIGYPMYIRTPNGEADASAGRTLGQQPWAAD